MLQYCDMVCAVYAYVRERTTPLPARLPPVERVIGGSETGIVGGPPPCHIRA